MKILKLFLLIFFVLPINSLKADNEALKSKITKNLRCLVCQGQSIYDSDSEFANSLKILDTTDVEIIPQTMAPFPWHFGGQRFQNLFVNADEILLWCNELNLRMCLDVSHSQLTCNHFAIDFYDFCSKISKVSSHIHLGDASGVNGEGLQIGDGQIDFVKLGNILQKNCPDASFIPEIWQGHKNGGEGFWIALEKLENKI